MWFEWLFKYPRHAYQQGELAFAGEIGVLWWTAAIVLLALSVAFSRRLAQWSVLRRVPIHLLQIAAVGVILALIAQPVLEVTRLAPGVNTVAVLVDSSASMGLAAASDPEADGRSRQQVARDVVTRVVDQATGGAKTALFHFDDRLARVESTETLEPRGARSRLVDALTDLATNYDEAALAAIVVLTDGAQNAGDSTELEALAAAGVPVHPVAIGPAYIRGDVELLEFALPSRARHRALRTTRDPSSRRPGSPGTGAGRRVRPRRRNPLARPGNSGGDQGHPLRHRS